MSAGSGDQGGLFRALRHRNYRLFFIGQIISLTGTWMQSVAQAWLVYRLTGSEVHLGMMGFASQVPVFLLATWGGALADRQQRQRILAWTQILSLMLALVLALLTLNDSVKIWHIYLIAVGLGIINAFDIPARQAFVVEMVGRQDMSNAIALNSSMFNAARIVGPAAAGLLIGAVGEGWCFLINAVSFMALLISLMMMNVPSRTLLPQVGSTLSHIAEGLRFVRHHAPIRSILLLLGLISLAGIPYMVLMPIIADQILGGDAGRLGILMSCSGVGALLGALTLAARRSVHGLDRWLPLAAAGFGLSVISFALSQQFWLSAILLLPTGFFLMLQIGTSNTLLQVLVPDELRGRVMSLYSMMFMGMAPLGSLLGGFAAAYIGVAATICLGGITAILAALWFVRYLKTTGNALAAGLTSTS